MNRLFAKIKENYLRIIAVLIVSLILSVWIYKFNTAHDMRIAFLIKFTLTNILFSLIIGLVLVKYNNKTEGRYSNLELLLYSFGLGPVFTILILYFLLMTLQGYSDVFYLAAVLLVYTALLVLGRKSISLLAREIKEKFQTFNKKKTLEHVLYFSFLLILLVVFTFIYMTNTLQIPIEGHDTLIHGNIGKMYYAEKAVEYSDRILNKKSGFFFTGSPKPSFSLLLTWEMILNGCFSSQTGALNSFDMSFDLYFRSVSAYYGLLILLVQFCWLYRKNRYLALLGIVVLFSAFKFFQIFVSYHLDSYRLFFLILSWIFLAYSLKNRDRLSLFLLGVFSGFTAFTHVIGGLVAIVNGLAFFLFLGKPLKERLLKTLVLFLVILIFGGLHYILEAFWGAKWGFLTYF